MRAPRHSEEDIFQMMAFSDIVEHIEERLLERGTLVHCVMRLLFDPTLGDPARGRASWAGRSDAIT